MTFGWKNFNGFCFQVEWHGEHYYLHGHYGNAPTKTNVPQSRVSYRHSTLVMMREYLHSLLESHEVDGSLSQVTYIQNFIILIEYKNIL